MKDKRISLIGSNATITNLPIKEVSLLAQGSLPSYGYDPGDFIELLAGRVTTEEGRLEQFLTWFSAFLTTAGMTPRIHTLTYGEEKQIFQIFKKLKNIPGKDNHGWYMVYQILPPGGRRIEPESFLIDKEKKRKLKFCDGYIIIDDSGNPPGVASELKELSPESWVIALGITAAHWEKWARGFGENFVLFCRLSDLETTRMEMDSAVIWESVVAMSIRALKSNEVGLWDRQANRFRCHIIVEMFPDGLLYLGPKEAFFRHREGALPGLIQTQRTGSIPCYDTLVVAMLATDILSMDSFPFRRSYFFDFSRRVLFNWKLLYEHGYFFQEELEFPNMDFSSTYPSGAPCTFLETKAEPCLFELPITRTNFDQVLDVVSSQEWTPKKKAAVRSFFEIQPDYPYNGISEEMLISKAGYIGTILSILKHLKEEVNRGDGFQDLRLFHVGSLQSTDPIEIAPIITLQRVMDNYVSKDEVKRPLCIGVFGPPGSGKSFAVREVSKVISERFGYNPFEFFEFNLTQFSGQEEINSAIDLVRASVAKGQVPVAFWDEFDCRYDGNEFGYLRYFLPSMQDGVTFVHGIPRYIGRSIFVFAGSVKGSWDAMENLLRQEDKEAIKLVKALKIPDFMSRLRVVLDIEGVDLPDELLRDSASKEELERLRRCLLKRAFIIAHQMNSHWRRAARKTSGLLLRLLIAKYKFGARSIEAVIEASHAANRLVYGLPELITPPAARIHAEWRIDLERRVDRIRKDLCLRGVW